MAKLLVTGGAGFIGANFARLAVREGYEARVLDKLTYAGNLENLRELRDAHGIEFIRGDVCRPSHASRAIQGCDAVVHFAAETHVDRSISDAGTFVATDVYGTFVMLEAARKANVDRFLHISTDEVYGESGKRPSREDSALNPKSPYAASKAGADRLAYSYHATFGLPVVITRCVNNYGPFQHPEKAIPLFTICGLVGHPLPVYGSGSHRREWIHVADHGRALLRLLRKRGIEGQTFNIGTGERRSTLQVATAIVDLLDRPRATIRRIEDRPGHVWSHAVDAGKLRRATSWRPIHGFDEALPEVTRWYMRNVGWWRRTMLGRARGFFESRYPKLVRAVEDLRGRRRIA